MALFGLFKEKAKPPPPALTGTLDPKWERNARGSFNNLLDLEPDDVGIVGAGGVYVIWHGGIQPEWVFIGETADLGQAIDDAANNDEIAEYDVRGRLFVTWSPVIEEYRPGVVLYLTKMLKPVVDNPDAATEESDELTPVSVLTPGATAG